MLRGALQVVQLDVTGMHCSSCSTAVESALRAVPGVQSASVSLVMRRATAHVHGATVKPVPFCSLASHPVESANDLLETRAVGFYALNLVGMSAGAQAVPGVRVQEHLVEAVEDAGFEARLVGQGDKGTLQLRVGGMTCGSCSAAVEKALQAAPGVLSASVNLLAGTALVSLSLVSKFPA